MSVSVSVGKMKKRIRGGGHSGEREDQGEGRRGND